MAKHKFTNVSNGPRGLYAATGLVMVEAGETVEVELAKDEEPAEEWFAPAASKEAKAADRAAKADDAE